MNVETGTARTGFSKLYDALPPQFLRAWPEPSSAVTNYAQSAEQFSGTTVALACVPGTLTEFLMGTYPLQDSRRVELWRAQEGYCQVSSGPNWGLVAASSGDQGILRCDIGSGWVWPADPNKHVFVEYTLQAPAATGCMLDAATSYDITGANLFTSHTSFNLHEVKTGVSTPTIERVFALADLVEFEDGIENEFTKQLKSLVKEWGGSAIVKLAPMIFRPAIRTEIAAQTLLCLGRIDDKGSVSARSRILRRGLLSSSAKVRDAATVGIASMADRGAKADLVAAVERESIPSLRDDMRAVLEYLKTPK